MRKKLIAGNWKMHGAKDWAADLATSIAHGAKGDVDIVVCPSASLIYPVVTALENGQNTTTPSIKVGAQDCHYNEQGAHTGDTSPAMLASLGVSHVILGHSERRSDHGETDAIVLQKSLSALSHGLVAIICIGETESQQQAGETETVLKAQILGSIPNITTADKVVIAYEPVWAIGTGKTPTPKDVQHTHAFIRTVLAEKLGEKVAQTIRILYGGSVNPNNAKDLLTLPDVDGALVGGASLKADAFLGIVDALS